MEYYELKKNNDIFGHSGRVINYAMYSSLSEEHKLLFKNMNDEPHETPTPSTIKVKNVGKKYSRFTIDGIPKF